MDDTAMTNPAHLKRPMAHDATRDVRMDRVEELRVAIASREYDVSSEDLADRLMDHMRGLSGAETKKRS